MNPVDKILASEVITAVRAAAPQGQPVYLVGGAVRDALLGLPPHDLDFCLSEKVKLTARKIAELLGAAFYPLDEERSNYRLIHKDSQGRRYAIDFAAIRGTDIEADLHARDFTINAMAMNVIASGAMLDPTGGAGDLKNKILRMCAPDAFQQDPIRILRGLRLAPIYGLRIEDNTRQAMVAEIPNLNLVSAERQRDEIFRILESPHPSTALRLLEVMGGLPYILPELSRLNGTRQSPPHYQDVWNHTLSVLDNLILMISLLASEDINGSQANLILALASQRLGRFRLKLAQHFTQEISSGRTLIGLINLAALFHDVAKAKIATIDPGGRIRNFGHEKVGAQIAIERAEALQFSRLECLRLYKIIQHHMRIHSLVATGKPPSKRAVYRFFKDTGDAGIDVCLIALADILGTYGPSLPQDTWQDYLDTVRMLMEAWWEKKAEEVDPPVLLDGNELQQLLNLEPGPRIGLLLEDIREAQADGTVLTKDQAIELAKYLIETGTQ